MTARDTPADPSNPAGPPTQPDEPTTTSLAAQARSHMLAGLLHHVLQTQERERRQVAHLLHDDLGQTLAAIKIRLQLNAATERQRPNDPDDDTVRIIDDALLQVRRIVPALRPVVLDDLGLVPALRDLAAQTEASTAMPVVVACAPGCEEIRPPSDRGILAFRVAQSALENVIGHARATRVDIHVRLDAAMMVVEVSDDGRGFHPLPARFGAGNEVGHGMGLLLMQERATLLGGTLEVESAPGQGCRVRLSCPLQSLLPMQ